MTARPRVTVVSPHFDDVPLSLGQSLTDGALARCQVEVRVVFGRTNWTTWVHPTAGRARAITPWRMLEEQAAAVRFGYRYRAAGWDEAILRRGGLGGEALLDSSADLSGDPLVGEVRDWLELIVRPEGRAAPDLVLAPAGLGGHVDHRIVALAAARWTATSSTAVGFYEDRPYVAHLSVSEQRRQLDALGLDLTPLDVSGPISASAQRWVRRCYPSQMDAYFVEAMDLDRSRGSVERVWLPDRPPSWLR